ncbi:hypothetical protein PAAG_00823 [Paracoccidioides lutzii Pb01]|uniref:Prolyl 4-hydroxylase alpha subunit domain-containing protein n=1 Tax=Paracoccidioides lutzii (strain ATCC MYA-826 / Pb01) TaxID=502779 RepID=C1GQM8_PARBA|nr:hypothetical protein PAAG_00823 [Paracoccidioides lutzii Pb01]EEH37902.2 hypothetical protein PAAG_00823 [Paracoccidioides lutzii Pb01]
MATYHQRPSWLPEDFLCADPQNASSRRIDFTKTNSAFPEYEGHYALMVDDLLSKEECDLLIRAAEESTISDSNKTPKWDQALINVGNGQQMLHTDTRRCSRILWDCPWLAERILSRIRPFIQDDIEVLRDVPSIIGREPAQRQETWRLTRLNERLRFLRYYRGEYFRPHMDGSYVTPGGAEISLFTLHLYLNGEPGDRKMADLSAVSDDQVNSLPLRGGATTFFPPFIDSDDARTFSVNPQTGSVLVFQHRGLAHSGDEVLQGTKYTLRTDFMFCRDGTVKK